ncbi:MAG: endonuclease/exonuclease/phosphatase family protein [Oscillospiraceae bacterium]|nr:endonuclease/exonuclease/phosphatase family protein [Oscillospiraceae bacterium]
MKFKKIAVSILAILLAVILIACVVFFWKLPYYVNHKETRDLEVNTDNGIRMMSCNLRYIAPTDLGQRSWFHRADLILDDIEAQAPGIIGFQEATRWHYAYLVDTLPGYDSVITYRDDSPVAEGCPIFYNTGLYTLVDKGSFWLSETPEVMSKDWGSSHYRVCSYVILTDNQSGKDFVVFNTHLDHVSDEARIKGIDVVLDKIAQFGGLPAVIMGDFNAEEGSETYISVTENFLDARYATENTSDACTYQGWGEAENPRRIDYFMISKTGFDVIRYDVLPAIHDGVYSSDHCPIVLDVQLN